MVMENDLGFRIISLKLQGMIIWWIIEWFLKGLLDESERQSLQKNSKMKTK